MKHVLVILFTFLGTAVGNSWATVLLSGFGTDGALVGQTSPQGATWAQILTTTTPALTVSSGTVSFAATNGQDASNTFSALSSGSLYYAFTLNVTTPTATSSFISEFASNSSLSSVGGRLFIQQSGAGYRIGSSRATTGLYAGDSGTSGAGGTLSVSTDYRIVLRYDIGTSPTAQFRLYVDPTNLTNEGANTIYLQSTGAGSGLIAIDTFALFQNSSTSPVLSISNLTVATTFAEAAPVPEPAVSIALLAGGCFVLFRARSRGALC